MALSIPPAFYKSERAHVVPLSTLAANIVRQLPRFEGEFVFSTTDGRRPISGFSKSKRRLDKLSGVSDWRIHDIRRTVATELGRLQIDQLIIDRVLGHSPSALRATYNQHEYLSEKYLALSAWSGSLESLSGKTENDLSTMKIGCGD